MKHKKTDTIFSRYILILAAIISSNFLNDSYATEILRFEHFNTSRGLSQNTASSVLCDSRGYLWIGTNNGLNRYDGNKFRVFYSEEDGQINFTHNRIINIWEDAKGFIWFETHDGHYHYFDPVSEQFRSLSDFLTELEEGHTIFSSFLQYSESDIWLGLYTRGVIRLRYNEDQHRYDITHYTSRGANAISNNRVSFITKDIEENIWIGTQKGLTLIEKQSIESGSLTFQHLFITHSFTSHIETATELWFGTSDAGILKFQKPMQLYTFLNTENTSTLRSNHITLLHITKGGRIIVGFDQKGLQINSVQTNQWQTIPLNGSHVNNIYEDRFGLIWIATDEFGLTGFNPSTNNTKRHQFLDPGSEVVPDEERHIFFEDSNDNLWVGTHEGALNLYDRDSHEFVHFRNDPSDPNSISSNVVLSIAEDHSGQLWIGTGQFHGGVEKVISKNPALDHILPAPDPGHISKNIVRAVFEDPQNRTWIGTKAGRLHVFEDDRQIHEFARFATPQGIISGFNVYCIVLDDDGHLWLGSKGKGILISQQPLSDYSNLSNITFDNYVPQDNDSTTLSHVNIYSMAKDKNGNIWIGTYGNGVNISYKNSDGTYSFTRINENNSRLSSNLVRNILADSNGRVWIATGYGLNLIENMSQIHENKIEIRSFFTGQYPGSISLNDVIHLYEDSGNNIWAATFGGGINRLTDLNEEQAIFEVFNQSHGLSNNVVYSIQEDNQGFLWFSTENGLSRLNTANNSFEVFNTNNGLNFNIFSENTSYRTRDERLLFGGFIGLEVISPDKIVIPQWNRQVELTNFQLFNKDVPIGEDSPLQKSISFTNEIVLRHFQSSFSFEFSVLDFLDPDKTQYAYKLDNFDDDWNVVSQVPQATYTNLSPGAYTFRVRATNRSGEWIDNERRLRITILPPWYKTRWAFMLYSGLLVMLFMVIFSTIAKINRYRNDLKIEKRVNEMKLRFFTNISHEIRTPLTLIIGPIEDLIKKPVLDNSDKPRLEIIRRNGKRMLHLTNQLLDFRKVQNNKMRLKISEFDIVEFTRHIYESFEPLANHKNLVYEFSTTTKSYFIWADPTKLDMIIYNIISNALKFTDASKQVKIELNDNEESEFFHIKITDEGRGIAKEELPQIFERYTILSGKELAGTGIGLSLSNELTRLHHGEITVESEPGVGSSFTLKLRKGKEHFVSDEKVIMAGGEEKTVETIIKPSPHEEIVSTNSEPDILKVRNGDRPLVMIVEDNHEIGEYISQSLSPDFASCLASNGQEALDLLNSQNPDLIISDVMMPVMDGMEMTEKIKDNFATSHIPIILLTSKSGVNDQIAGVEKGADVYITKPFNSDYLKAVAKNLIEQRKNIFAKFRDNKTIDPSTLKVNSKDEEFLQKLISYVEENHSEEFTIEELADTLCVSRTVFYNKVKGLTGLSPVEFVRQLKLKIAAHLLTQGYNVSEAAIKVGFSDARYFSRQFKALFGYLPSKHVQKK
ncbi:hybrid sensor histidine kinase/response regulator transcription factor [Alkalitalea saponilacus]|nr:two-component regulator propeller domain-containing protein [Alkalitalea saponilacus]